MTKTEIEAEFLKIIAKSQCNDSDEWNKFDCSKDCIDMCQKKVQAAKSCMLIADQYLASHPAQVGGMASDDDIKEHLNECSRLGYFNDNAEREAIMKMALIGLNPA